MRFFSPEGQDTGHPFTNKHPALNRVNRIFYWTNYDDGLSQILDRHLNPINKTVAHSRIERASTWAKIRARIGAFLDDLFRQGAFQGATPR